MDLSRSETLRNRIRPAIILLLIFLAAYALLGLLADSLAGTGPQGTISDPERIATFDAEFCNYIGSDHRVAKYHYVDAYISDRLEFGYGPLYDVAGYQVIIGKSGAVGAIAYGKYSHGRWDLYPGPHDEWTSAFILVFDGCVAPVAWWNRPLSASMLYDVPTSDGYYLPELMVWIPWPDELDFDDPPAEATIRAQSWYWNGHEYVEFHARETPHLPPIAPSTINVSAPQGAFPYVIIRP